MGAPGECGRSHNTSLDHGRLAKLTTGRLVAGRTQKQRSPFHLCAELAARLVVPSQRDDQYERRVSRTPRTTASTCSARPRSSSDRSSSSSRARPAAAAAELLTRISPVAALEASREAVFTE